jgi:hypothetical protein
MSRIVTPSSPTTSHPQQTVVVPQDKIAQRAYEKWVKRGRTHGHDKQDWIEAEAELKAEYSRGSTMNRR